MTANTTLDSLAYAQGQPQTSALFKQSHDDFQVAEHLGFTPSGAGEHLFCYIEKQGQNTEEVIQAMAKHLQISPRDVGHAGLKDKIGKTQQWLSFYLPGKGAAQGFFPAEDHQAWQENPLFQGKILQQTRHDRKLKVGALKGNFFTLVLRQIIGDHSDLEQRLLQVQSQGFPNYFGEQRFGRHGNNLVQATAWFKGEKKVRPHHQGLLISAVRSAVFNAILSNRIAAGHWNQFLSGEVLNLQGTSRTFVADDDPLLSQRLAEGDIHLTGLLPGIGDWQSQSQVLALEKSICQDFEGWMAGLARHQVTAGRRPLRVLPQNLSWKWQDNDLKLKFYLPAGAYATAMLRELVQIRPLS